MQQNVCFDTVQSVAIADKYEARMYYKDFVDAGILLQICVSCA